MLCQFPVVSNTTSDIYNCCGIVMKLDIPVLIQHYCVTVDVTLYLLLGDKEISLSC